MPPPVHESIIGLPDFKIISYQGTKTVEITAEYIGRLSCIHCKSEKLRKKERFDRVFKHHSIGLAKSILLIRTFKFYCRDCGRYFNQRLPGVLPYQRVTEPLKDEISIKHHHGHSILTVSRDLSVGQATVGRYYKRYLQREFNEHKNASVPKVLGIDEKKFSKKLGYQTTLVNLQRHTVYELLRPCKLNVNHSGICEHNRKTVDLYPISKNVAELAPVNLRNLTWRKIQT